jgi:hypothetical protein
MIDSTDIPAFPPQISRQFRQNPARPVRTVHPVPVCVQGSGRPPRGCMPDSSSLSDQEAVLCAADLGIGQQ